MKQVLAATSVMLLCCYSTLLNAQQTYIRNYSTHTEYITVPAATVPSSYKSFTVPTYTYDKPVTKEAEEREETPEDRMRDRFSGISSAYQQKKYDEMISLSDGFDPSVLQRYYGRESFYAMLVNSYIYLNRKKEVVNYFLKAQPDVVMFSDPAFSLSVADEFRAQGYFKEACIYFDKANARGVYNKEYQLSYCVTLAEVAGREQETIEAFDMLLKNDDTHAPLNYYYYGKFMLGQNKSNSAEYYFDEFIKYSTEKKYDGYLLRSQAAFLNKNYEKCVADAKEYKKNHVCSVCDELILKVKEAQSNPVYIAEQKRQEFELAEQKRKNEIAEAEQKKKEENELAVAKKRDEEYNSYITEHGIKEEMNTIRPSSGEYYKQYSARSLSNYYNAILAGDLKSVYFLMKNGNDINAKYSGGIRSYGYTLFDALEFEQYAIAHFLIINNVNLSLQDDFKKTPLHFICGQYRYGSTEKELKGPLQIARMLIEKGADINALNKYGATPLHNACSNGNYNLAKLLLESGAATDIVDGDEKKTALGLARKYEHKEIITLLKQYKAK